VLRQACFLLDKAVGNFLKGVIMTAMTFESINISPRRAAVRRNSRPAPIVVIAPKPHTAIASVRAGSGVIGSSNKAGLIALIGLTVVLHAVVISAVDRRGAIAPAVPKIAPLAIEMAPPPPPPPVVPPKPLPQIAKPVAAPVKPAPALPVVRSEAVDTATPTADTVQVATAPTPAPAPAAAPVERVTEPRGYAGYLRNPAPTYPQSAQDSGFEGQVVLKVHVLASGQPDNISVLKSSGHKILDDAAIKAVTSWAFDPAKRGETPVDGWVKVPLNFQLS
jgi:periplasmic protein TonB